MNRRRRPSLRIALPVALVVIAAAVTAVVVLSDDTTDAEKVEQTFNAYQKAMADRDSATLCELTSPATQQMIREQTGERGRTGTCQDFYELMFDKSRPAHIDNFARADVDSVEVRGDTARVKYYGASEAHFVKVEGRWLDFFDLGG